MNLFKDLVNKTYDDFLTEHDAADIPPRALVQQTVAKTLAPILSIPNASITEREIGIFVGAFCEGWVAARQQQLGI